MVLLYKDILLNSKPLKTIELTQIYINYSSKIKKSHNLLR